MAYRPHTSKHKRQLQKNLFSMCLQFAWASYGLVIPSDEIMWRIRAFVLCLEWGPVRALHQQKFSVDDQACPTVVGVFIAAFILKCCNPFLVLLPWFPPLHYQVILLLSPLPHFPSAAPHDSQSWNAQSNWLCDAVKYKILQQKLTECCIG